MSIITNNKSLRIPSKPVSIFEGLGIIKRLENELRSSSVKGIGLSGIQIGEPVQVCIIRSDISLNLINPEIVKKYDLSLFIQEGCLSFPNTFISTKRFAEVVVKDLLHPAGIILTGANAVVVQHEIDHIVGKTIFDREVKIPKGPNDKCWCGSNRKYKKCCVRKEIR
jgi:peptide deformylase